MKSFLKLIRKFERRYGDLSLKDDLQRTHKNRAERKGYQRRSQRRRPRYATVQLPKIEEERDTLFERGKASLRGFFNNPTVSFPNQESKKFPKKVLREFRDSCLVVSCCRIGYDHDELDPVTKKPKIVIVGNTSAATLLETDPRAGTCVGCFTLHSTHLDADPFKLYSGFSWTMTPPEKKEEKKSPERKVVEVKSREKENIDPMITQEKQLLETSRSSERSRTSSDTEMKSNDTKINVMFNHAKVTWKNTLEEKGYILTPGKPKVDGNSLTYFEFNPDQKLDVLVYSWNVGYDKTCKKSMNDIIQFVVQGWWECENRRNDTFFAEMLGIAMVVVPKKSAIYEHCKKDHCKNDLCVFRLDESKIANLKPYAAKKLFGAKKLQVFYENNLKEGDQIFLACYPGENWDPEECEKVIKTFRSDQIKACARLTKFVDIGTFAVEYTKIMDKDLESLEGFEKVAKKELERIYERTLQTVTEKITEKVDQKQPFDQELLNENVALKKKIVAQEKKIVAQKMEIDGLRRANQGHETQAKSMARMDKYELEVIELKTALHERIKLLIEKIPEFPIFLSKLITKKAPFIDELKSVLECYVGKLKEAEKIFTNYDKCGEWWIEHGTCKILRRLIMDNLVPLFLIQVDALVNMFRFKEWQSNWVGGFPFKLGEFQAIQATIKLVQDTVSSLSGDLVTLDEKVKKMFKQYAINIARLMEMMFACDDMKVIFSVGEVTRVKEFRVCTDCIVNDGCSGGLIFMGIVVGKDVRWVIVGMMTNSYDITTYESPELCLLQNELISFSKKQGLGNLLLELIELVKKRK